MTDPIVQGPFQEAVALAFPAAGDLWFAGDVFLAYFDSVELEWVFENTPSGVLLDLDQIPDGPILLASSSGCSMWNGKTLEQIGTSNPLGRDVLAVRYFDSLTWYGGLFDDLFHRDSEDLEGVAWLATYDHTESTWDQPVALSDEGGSRQGVHTLAILDNVLYVAGRFSFTDPISALTGYSIGYWDPANGLRRLAGGGINPPNTSFAIRALARYQGKLYLGGYHTRPTVPSDHIVALDETTGTFSALPNDGLNDEVHGLAVSAAGELWVVGEFTQTADATKDLRYAAIFDGTSWREPDPANPIDTGPAPRKAYTVIPDGGDMWVGGFFDDIGGDTSLRDIARFSDNKWKTGYREGDVNDVILVRKFRDRLILPTAGATRLSVASHGLTTETITISGTGFYDGVYDSSRYSVVDADTLEIDAAFFGNATGTISGPGVIEVYLSGATYATLPASVVLYGTVYAGLGALTILSIPDSTHFIVDTPFLGDDNGGYTAFWGGGYYYELGYYLGVSESGGINLNITAATGTGRP